ncbi:hypothetical protein U1Q18_034093 [Sarracenia purpurea var. burkii]
MSYGGADLGMVLPKDLVWIKVALSDGLCFAWRCFSTGAAKSFLMLNSQSRCCLGAEFPTVMNVPTFAADAALVCSGLCDYGFCFEYVGYKKNGFL